MTADEKRNRAAARLKAWKQRNADHVRAYQKAWKEAHKESEIQKGREYYKEHKDESIQRTLKWMKNHPERTKEIAQEFYRRNKESMREKLREYRKRNPEKVRAQKLLQYAVKKGLIQRPDECSRCNESGKIQAHHPDYSLPFLVIWLCRSCHYWEHHQEERRTGRKLWSISAKEVLRSARTEDE